MPAKFKAPPDEPPAPPADPIAKAGDYKSIAAQYAKAKALKEKEDAASRTQGDANAKVAKEVEKLNKGKEGLFKESWNWAIAFYIWLM
jgi:hypothetical protein